MIDYFNFKNNQHIVYENPGCALSNCIDELKTYLEANGLKNIAYKILNSLSKLHEFKIAHQLLDPNAIYVRLPFGGSGLAGNSHCPSGNSPIDFSNTSKLLNNDKDNEDGNCHNKSGFLTQQTPSATNGQQIILKIGNFQNSIFQSKKSRKNFLFNEFSAPEIILNLSYSEKSDVWSFGCLMFYIFTGRSLFLKSSKEEVIYQIKEILKNYSDISFIDLFEDDKMLSSVTISPYKKPNRRSSPAT